MATLVIAVDGSNAANQAARLGVEVAKASGDSVALITVWQVMRADFGVPVSVIDRDFVDTEREWAQRVLDEAAEVAHSAGVEVESVLAEGDPASEICRLARERQARMIVVGTHGWGAIRSLLLGGVTNAVLHHAPCAVLTGPPADQSVADIRERSAPERAES